MTSPEKTLWLTYILTMAQDACGVFDYESHESFAVQKEKILQSYRDNKKILYTRHSLHNYNTARARGFFESSQFDEIANEIGYDSLFVNKTFQRIQKAISYEKEIYETYKASPLQIMVYALKKQMRNKYRGYRNVQKALEKRRAA